MSLLVFTGASQFAAVGVIGGGGSPAAALASALLLAARNGAYGLALAPVLRGPLGRRLRRRPPRDRRVDGDGDWPQAGPARPAPGLLGRRAGGVRVLERRHAGRRARRAGHRRSRDLRARRRLPGRLRRPAGAPPAVARRQAGGAARRRDRPGAGAVRARRACRSWPRRWPRSSACDREPAHDAGRSSWSLGAGAYGFKVLGLVRAGWPARCPTGSSRCVALLPAALLAALIVVETFSDGQQLVLDARARAAAWRRRAPPCGRPWRPARRPGRDRASARRSRSIVAVGIAAKAERGRAHHDAHQRSPRAFGHERASELHVTVRVRPKGRTLLVPRDRRRPVATGWRPVSGTARFAVHGHFYQPPRENPWTEEVPVEPSAAPFHDWNERITAESYRPNAFARIVDDHGLVVAIVNNYGLLGFNVGPTLAVVAGACTTRRPTTGCVAADARRRHRHRPGLQPLDPPARHTSATCGPQIRWGLADFEHRFGRRAEGIWLPETAVNDDGARGAGRGGRGLHDPGAAARRPSRSEPGTTASVGAPRRRPVASPSSSSTDRSATTSPSGSASSSAARPGRPGRGRRARRRPRGRGDRR